MDKVKKMLQVVCLQECADHRMKYEKDVIYSLPEDHPCLQYFKKVRETTDPAELGPPDVVLKKGG